jgi:hypothetical protein
MKTRGWEGWLIVSFLAIAAALFTVVTTLASSLHHCQYACQEG